MKLYITKWALTAGIIEVDSDRLKFNLAEKEPHFYGKYCVGATPQIFYPEKDITDNLEDAKIIADTMRIKKILSLKKQIKKLENKTF